MVRKLKYLGAEASEREGTFRDWIPTVASRKRDQGKQILFVTDVLSDQHLIQLVMKDIESPHTVIFAERRNTVYELLGPGKESYPALILIDYYMGGEEGLRLLKWKQTQPHLAHIPVVIMLPALFDRLMIECYEAGANCCLQMPIDFFELGRTFRPMFDFWIR